MYQHENYNLLTILQVNITMKKAGSKMEHQGIKIEFIGQIGKEFNFIHLHFFKVGVGIDFLPPGKMGGV